MRIAHFFTSIYFYLSKATKFFLRLIKQLVDTIISWTKLLNKSLQFIHSTQCKQALLCCLLNIRILIFQFLKQNLKKKFEFRRCPVEIFGFSDDYRLEWVNALLTQLRLWTANPIIQIKIYHFVDMLISLHKSKQTVMRSLPQLRLGVT